MKHKRRTNKEEAHSMWCNCKQTWQIQFHIYGWRVWSKSNFFFFFYPSMDLKDGSTKDFDLTSHMLNHISKGSDSAPVWLYNLCSCGWMLLCAEPLEGSANRELCRGMASVATRSLASFLQIDISHHAHTAWISIHNPSGGGHWGEEERRQHSTEIQWGIEPRWVI